VKVNNPIAPDKLYRASLRALRSRDVEIDCSGIQENDSCMVAVLISLQKESANFSGSLSLVNVSEALATYLKAVPALKKPIQSKEQMGFLESAGEYAFQLFHSIVELIHLFTESIYWSTVGRFDPKALPIRGTLLQMLRLGSDALPIVFILSFLIGLTLSYQSALQLESLGGSLYLVRGIGISMFSEIGPLITAIILAGRSGSSITAEIASMVVQDEVKALRTMGIHPVPFLVVPRFQAMTITVPLLTFASVFAGIFSGFVVAILYIKMPVSLFFSELRDGIPLKLLWQCAVKSMVFGWIITLVASQKGFAARGGADAVGRATTECVVFSISAIIIADAMFSFIFY
jgi:phospholipid/cholesterol/gamma-HCH transport system permease protein